MINIGVAAPMAFFPFSGWRDSFFGVVHGQGRDAVEFFTQQKVVVELVYREATEVARPQGVVETRKGSKPRL